MTAEKRLIKTNTDRHSLIATLFFAICTAILILYVQEARDAVIYGIRLSAASIIPAIFPFFILSDFLLAFYRKSGGLFSKVFRRIFYISEEAIPTFIIGILCGFPLGVKGAAELYKSGRITKDECERLSGFVNNPSLAFTVSGVGLGMRGSLSDGLLLYFSVIFSSILTGIFFRRKVVISKNAGKNTGQNFNLSVSIKNAGYSSVAISSYIIFFSALLGVMSAIIKNDLLLTLITPIFEVGNATSMISGAMQLSPIFAFSLTAFALGFSGLSVFLQAASFLHTEISRFKIFFMKSVEGLICASVAALLFLIFRK